jgi:hypothetical protein
MSTMRTLSRFNKHELGEIFAVNKETNKRIMRCLIAMFTDKTLSRLNKCELRAVFLDNKETNKRIMHIMARRDDLNPFRLGCPGCGGSMVVRKKRLSKSEYYGCASFPVCIGTRSLEEVDILKKAAKEAPSQEATSSTTPKTSATATPKKAAKPKPEEKETSMTGVTDQTMDSRRRQQDSVMIESSSDNEEF